MVDFGFVDFAGGMSSIDRTSKKSSSSSSLSFAFVSWFSFSSNDESSDSLPGLIFPGISDGFLDLGL